LGYLWEYGFSLIATFFLSFVVLIREGFDVIHAHNPPDTFVFVAIFYKIFGKRFVFDHHDLTPEMYYHARFHGTGSKAVYRLLLWIERLTFRVADHVISTNESYKAIAVERGGLAKESVTVVRNGPNLDRLQVVPPDPELSKKATHIIGYVGEMGPQDGLDYLLRALKHLVDDLGFTDFYCVIIGQGSALPGLRKMADELNLNDHVWLTGRVSDEDLVRYLSTTDICVDPDPSNPFNDRCTMIKMMEFMTFSKPIVAFDLPEHRFTAQSAAIYVPNNDELEFARAIARLMDDPELRRKMGTTGRQRIEQELAWTYSAQNLVSAYEKLFAPAIAETISSPRTTQKDAYTNNN
jgi:glycosyltransferase involved in cell wall biosynthesis